MAEGSCHLNSKLRILVVLLRSREKCPTATKHTKASSFCGQQDRVTGLLGAYLWPIPEATTEKIDLPTAYAAHLICGCQSLLHLSDLLDKTARRRKYQNVWVIKTLSCNIIKGILKSMTSIWKDIFHTLSSTVGDVAEQKQVKQGVLLMKVLVEKAAGDKMS